VVGVETLSGRQLEPSAPDPSAVPADEEMAFMRTFGAESRVGALLEDTEARAALQEVLPGLADSPHLAQVRKWPIGKLVQMMPALAADPEAQQRLWASLGRIEDRSAPAVRRPAIEPDPDHEGPEVPRGSASATAPAEIGVHERYELVLTGPAHGNPFVDVDVHAEFAGPGGATARVGGFYDGDGRYVVRFLFPVPGRWTFTTRSTARSLDGVAGVVDVTPSTARGPVRVADGFHFRYADGTRYLPIGTTAYAWTHQGDDLQERTLGALAESPFTKIRMCVFPKSYAYNSNEPEHFVFPRGGDGDWDVTRFDLSYFAALERRLDQLAERGIEADLILFHPYDRWGFAELGAAVDDRYVRYVVRRLSGFANVWWSMANEYDLVFGKSGEDWERLAATVVREDPVGHLRSIHNCLEFYDQSRPWITHSSLQRVDTYRTAENTDGWRTRWGKPVVVDECGYEGDLEHGWGNLTGEEMTRRCWEGAVRGGYIGHGETYHADDEVVWWSKGGTLRGSSPERIAFLRRITQESPTGVLDPLPSERDAPRGGVPDRYVVIYLGFHRPRSRTVTLPPGVRVHVDVLDTWNTTVERLPGAHEGTVTVPLPARPYMAIRLVAVD
jgi:uncharacterized protein DUF5605/uncharacterized protein DUF5060/uncharacterized protein DUF4038